MDRIQALDSETCLIMPGVQAPVPVCVTSSEPWILHARFNRSAMLERLERAFSTERTVFANCGFDLAVFMAAWPELIGPIFFALSEGRIHDVQIREKLIDLAAGRFRFEETEDGEIRPRGYSLAAIAARRLPGEPPMDKDTWRLRYHDLIDTPAEDWPDGARAYALTDAAATMAIWRDQEQHAEFLRNEAAQVRAAVALRLSSCWGIRTDAEGVQALRDATERAIREILPGLREAGLVRPDGTRNTKAAVRRIVSIMGDTARLTESGESYMRDRSMSLDDMLKVAEVDGKYFSVAHDPALESGDPIMMDYARYCQLRSILTGTVKDMERGSRGVPVQPSYEVLVATGRTSAARPNIQNLRRVEGVRECFVPRPGRVFVACDYSSAELHTLAQTCYDLFGYSKLGDALNAGLDVHLWVASLIGGFDYENPPEEAPKLRQIAKAANFGFPGGCSAARFVGFANGYGVQIDARQAARIKAQWFAAWPEMWDYFEHIEKCQDKRGWHYVLQERAGRLRSRCTYTSACNSFFQGLASDGAKAAIWEVTRRQLTEPGSALYGSRIVAFIHDEILIECDEDGAHEAAQELREVMEREFNHFVPDCPTQAEPVIMRRWSKKAKPTFDDEGRLIPWENTRKTG